MQINKSLTVTLSVEEVEQLIKDKLQLKGLEIDSVQFEICRKYDATKGVLNKQNDKFISTDYCEVKQIICKTVSTENDKSIIAATAVEFS